MNDDYSFISGHGSFRSDRRRFVKGTGSLVALGSLPGYLTANTERLQSSLDGIQTHQGMVLYRDHDNHAVAFADVLTQAGLTPVALSDDPVRQWRDGLHRTLTDSGVPLVGLTNWADYLLVSGLAGERHDGKRRHVMLEMQHAVEQPGKENWSAELAASFLHLPVAAGREAIQGLVQQYLAANAVTPGTPSLFSWLIA